MQRWLIASAVFLSACGGGSKGGPTSPTAPAPAANRVPVISSATISPVFGIAHLTSFVLTAEASDPDGDPITYRWSTGDWSSDGQTARIVFGEGGEGDVRVTVTDSRGGSSFKMTNAVTVGGMAGSWRGTAAIVPQWVFLLALQQDGTKIVGNYADNVFGQGRLDPDHPNTITATGRIEIRLKVGTFSDFVLRGQMDGTGRRITGTLHNSGFNGEPFELVKQ